MRRSASLREEAAMIRHLSTLTANPAMRDELRKLAADYEAVAAQMDRAANDRGAPLDEAPCMRPLA